MSSYPYIWRWGECGGKYPGIGKLKGERCRVICRFRLGTAAIEFKNGRRFVAPRRGLKRA